SGMRASIISHTASTSFILSAIMRSALVIWPGNHCIVIFSSISSVHKAKFVQRQDPQHDMADYISLVHHAEILVAAVARFVAVVAHDEHAALRHGDLAVKIYGPGGRLGDIRLVQGHAVHIDDALFEVDVHRLALRGYHALDYRLFAEAVLAQDDDIPVF